jgi:arylformamidase
MAQKMKIFDISRPLSETEPVYPGNTKVKLGHLKTFKKDGSMLSQILTGLHNGSHVDSPAHYVKDGRTVDKMELEKCMGWCRVLDMTKVNGEIGGNDIRRVKPRKGEIVLFKTRNSRPVKKFDKNFIHINEEAARLLLRAGVKAVGIDGYSIRKFRLRPDTVHPMLLRAGIAIYEGLLLDKVEKGVYYFIGLPLKIVGAEGSPVRAVLVK